MTRPNLPPHKSRPANAPLPLTGLTVIDFTQMLAGPFATQELGDLGAEVIKIEQPVKGDDSRHYTTTTLAGECAFFLSTNRNKKSVTLDLKSLKGQNLAKRLIEGADIVVENFSNGVMERLNLDYETVAKLNPKIIYCSISGYGRDEKSVTSRRGYDAMFQAASGLMSLTGEGDRLPMRTQVPILDTATALNATTAILAAVIARDRYDIGQFIEVALLDVAISVLTIYGMTHLVSGAEIRRTGNRAPQTSPSDVFATMTDPLFLTCGNNRMFRRLCDEGLDRPDIADLPEYGSNALRVKNVEALTTALANVFRTRTCEDWAERLSAIGVPAAQVMSIPDALSSPDVARREILSTIPHPKVGQVPNVRAPYLFSETPVADPVAPPLLGQHTESVLKARLGLTEADISVLRSHGAFGPSTPDPD